MVIQFVDTVMLRWTSRLLMKISSFQNNFKILIPNPSQFWKYIFNRSFNIQEDLKHLQPHGNGSFVQRFFLSITDTVSLIEKSFTTINPIVSGVKLPVLLNIIGHSFMDAHPILFEEVNLYYDQKPKSCVFISFWYLISYGLKKIIAGACTNFKQDFFLWR